MKQISQQKLKLEIEKCQKLIIDGLQMNVDKPFSAFMKSFKNIFFIYCQTRRTIMKDVFTPLKLLVREYQKLQFSNFKHVPFPQIPFRFAHVQTLCRQAPLRATAQLPGAESLSTSLVLNSFPFVFVVPWLSIESRIH